VRFHFAELYYNNIGDEIFDIYVNGALVYHYFDVLAHTGGVKSKAYILEVANITPIGPSGDNITVDLVPQLGNGGVFNASINGIEIVKP
jgi:hypothetical protein